MDGYINRKGKEIVKTNNDYCLDFYECRGWIDRCREGSVLINRKGKVLFKLDSISLAHTPHKNKPTAAGRQGFRGYVDYNLKQVIPFIYKRGEEFENGYAKVSIDGLHWGIINEKGNTVLPMLYNFYYSINGITTISKHGPDGWSKFGVVSTDGRLIVPIEYDQCYLGEGMITVSKNKMWGFYNLYAELVIPMQFNSAGVFKDGVAFVSKEKNKEGKFRSALINTKGELLTPYKYKNTSTWPYLFGLIKVEVDGDIKYFIDKYGNEFYEEE